MAIDTRDCCDHDEEVEREAVLRLEAMAARAAKDWRGQRAAIAEMEVVWRRLREQVPLVKAGGAPDLVAIRDLQVMNGAMARLGHKL